MLNARGEGESSSNSDGHHRLLNNRFRFLVGLSKVESRLGMSPQTEIMSGPGAARFRQ